MKKQHKQRKIKIKKTSLKYPVSFGCCEKWVFLYKRVVDGTIKAAHPYDTKKEALDTMLLVSLNKDAKILAGPQRFTFMDVQDAI